MTTKEQYLADPCGAASIPYWKVRSVAIHDGMMILHKDEYDGTGCGRMGRKPFFVCATTCRGYRSRRCPKGIPFARR